MDPLQLLILLLMSGICGVLAEWIVGFSPGNVLVSVILGVVGAFIGYTIANLIGLRPEWGLTIMVGTTPFPVLYCILGALLLVGLIKLVNVTGRSYFNRRKV